MALLFQKGKSVKDKVIITLGYKWPLKPKEILSHIKSTFNANVTYQAVYKSINELLDDGVIAKKDRGFMLNKEWVGTLKDYTAQVDQAYKNNAPNQDILVPGQTIVNSIWDWYYHVLLVLEKLIKDKYATKKPLVIRGTHEWNATIIGKEEFFRAVKVIRAYDIYTSVLVGNSFAESIARYWEKIGIHVARTTPETFMESTSDLVVIGDYIVQAIYPRKLIQDIHRFYDETTKVEEIDIGKSQRDVFYKKADIHVITVKNKDLADSIRKETLELFRKE